MAGSGLGHAQAYALLQGEMPGTGVTGVLDFIDHQVSANSGSISVRARFANADLHLLPGNYARLGIVLGPDRQALVLPQAMIETDQQGEFVYALDKNHLAHRRNLVTVALPGEEKEIITGLQAGEHIVVSGGAQVSEGQHVLIQKNTQPGKTGVSK